jgi:hypothetical protein
MFIGEVRQAFWQKKLSLAQFASRYYCHNNLETGQNRTSEVEQQKKQANQPASNDTSRYCVSKCSTNIPNPRCSHLFSPKFVFCTISDHAPALSADLKVGITVHGAIDVAKNTVDLILTEPPRTKPNLRSSALVWTHLRMDQGIRHLSGRCLAHSGSDQTRQEI